MPIQKPFFRIVRPMISNGNNSRFILDSRYADDRSMLCRSYKMLESDMKKLFEYIEPSNDNSATYSQRTYELLLRAATEFESNCKRILNANGILNANNINDYYKINIATKLSEYEVCMNIWRPQRKVIRPFIEWNNGYSLSWYQAYNRAKHDRQTNFGEANLDNLIKAVAGVYALLYAQFEAYSFNAYQQINTIEDDDFGAVFLGESIFSIIPPTTWSDNEKYDFDWESLKSDPEPFDKFSF